MPIRLEVGPKDLEARQVVAVRRDEGSKEVQATLPAPVLNSCTELDFLWC